MAEASFPRAEITPGLGTITRPLIGKTDMSPRVHEPTQFGKTSPHGAKPTRLAGILEYHV